MWVCVCVLQLKEKCVYDIKTIVQRISQGARNELERLRAIWVWLCHNIGGYITKTIQTTCYHTSSHSLTLYYE